MYYVRCETRECAKILIKIFALSRFTSYITRFNHSLRRLYILYWTDPVPQSRQQRGPGQTDSWLVWYDTLSAPVICSLVWWCGLVLLPGLTVQACGGGWSPTTLDGCAGCCWRRSEVRPELRPDGHWAKLLNYIVFWKSAWNTSKHKTWLQSLERVDLIVGDWPELSPSYSERLLQRAAQRWGCLLPPVSSDPPSVDRTHYANDSSLQICTPKYHKNKCHFKSKKYKKYRYL